MPLWIGAYLADTMRLTTLQHGAYLLMLMAYWRERAPLPDDDDELRSITKADKAEWKKLRPVLEKYFTVEGGVWHHKRVEHELASAHARQKAAAAKAAKAAEARWGHGAKHPPEDAPSDAPSIAQALQDDMHEQCPTPTPTPIGIPTPLENTATSVCVPPHTQFSEKFRTAVASRPELDSQLVWANFCEHYPPERRTLSKWVQWVKNERAGPPGVPLGDGVQVAAIAAQNAVQATRAMLDAASRGASPPSPEMRTKLRALAQVGRGSVAGA